MYFKKSVLVLKYYSFIQTGASIMQYLQHKYIVFYFYLLMIRVAST